MRCQIILEGDGGELDCREVETEEEIRDAMLLIVADCGYLAGGDVIRVVDTQAPRDNVVDLYMAVA